jgi:putative heme degradation protein
VKNTWLMSSPKKKSTRDARLEKIERILEAHEKSMTKISLLNFVYCEPPSMTHTHHFFLLMKKHNVNERKTEKCKSCVANLEKKIREESKNIHLNDM